LSNTRKVGENDGAQFVFLKRSEQIHSEVDGQIPCSLEEPSDPTVMRPSSVALHTDVCPQGRRCQGSISPAVAYLRKGSRSLNLFLRGGIHVMACHGEYIIEDVVREILRDTHDSGNASRYGGGVNDVDLPMVHGKWGHFC
jgi:hypothetical protein